MIAARCGAGGDCAARARWVLIAADTRQQVATCPSHLSQARLYLAPSLTIVIRRAGPAEVHICDWVTPLNRRPWAQRCSKPGRVTRKFELATVRFCPEHAAQDDALTAVGA